MQNTGGYDREHHFHRKVNFYNLPHETITYRLKLLHISENITLNEFPQLESEQDSWEPFPCFHSKLCSSWFRIRQLLWIWSQSEPMQTIHESSLDHCIPHRTVPSYRWRLGGIQAVQQVPWSTSGPQIEVPRGDGFQLKCFSDIHKPPSLDLCSYFSTQTLVQQLFRQHCWGA
jgi:hypothetical protein